MIARHSTLLVCPLSTYESFLVSSSHTLRALCGDGDVYKNSWESTRTGVRRCGLPQLQEEVRGRRRPDAER
jgi:hypothetical protein